MLARRLPLSKLLALHQTQLSQVSQIIGIYNRRRPDLSGVSHHDVILILDHIERVAGRLLLVSLGARPPPHQVLLKQVENGKGMMKAGGVAAAMEQRRRQWKRSQRSRVWERCGGKNGGRRLRREET